MTIERKRLEHGDKTILYRVRRSARRKKTMQISVDGEGVIVAAPTAVPDAEIQGFVLRKADWILETLAEAAALAESSRIINGNSLPYRGVPVILAIRSADVDAVRVELADAESGSPQFRIAVPESLAEPERSDALASALAAWYRARAETLIPESVERWLPKFGYKTKPVVIVRDQRRRWGSCSSDGVLRFNWRLAMLHPDLLDYVVAHELSHIEVMNHSPKFWAAVEKRMPDVRDRRRRLKEDGRALPAL